MPSIDKLQVIGQNLGQLFNSRSGCVHDMQSRCFETKLPNLKLKTWPKKLLGSLLLDIPSSAKVRNFIMKTLEPML